MQYTVHRDAAPESASHAVPLGPARTSQRQCISLTPNRPDENLPAKGESDSASLELPCPAVVRPNRILHR